MKIQGAVLVDSSNTRPFAESRPILVSEVDLDEPGPGEVLVRIECAGLCHSDLSVVDGSRPRPVPMLLGHEAAGRVEELGEGVDDVTVGQRVVMTFLPRCEQCPECRTGGRLPCRNGSASNAAGSLLGGGQRLHRGHDAVAHHLGVSGFASHAVVSRRSIVPVGDDVPADVAALLGCAVLTGGGALLNVGRPEPEQSVVIVGLGGVGMAALLVARALGVASVTAIDAIPGKLDTAAALGASAVYSPADAERAGIRGEVVVEAAGAAPAFATAVRLTAPGGRTVSVGLPRADSVAEVHPLGLVAEAREIVGSYLGSSVPSRDIPVYEALWREGRLPLERLISARLPLAEINSGMDELASGRALRQMIDVGEE
ncbi:alcohol dehydrogenase catalytic domain-containing protein [Microbacterium sp. NPDC016588]